MKRQWSGTDKTRSHIPHTASNWNGVWALTNVANYKTPQAENRVNRALFPMEGRKGHNSVSLFYV